QPHRIRFAERARRALALRPGIEDAVPVEDETAARGSARGDACGGRYENAAQRGERRLDVGRKGISGHFRSSPSIGQGTPARKPARLIASAADRATRA